MSKWIKVFRNEKFWYSCDDVEYWSVPNGFICSECGYHVQNKSHYCPNCGLPMDLEVNND